ncbi:hypothetical protein K402DRAFT_364682 [Aulographum hederae CBS 113979]|uniref:Uncharacterized protein n=1 Tax=Aulographum hederae CBS 113979 TaxID=1176131 RepID=A0A6G1GKQ2_9PEZI|nr:hypothetical protein K402DRAFT_364682 [Aulographum hederae CBS 113979]
MVDAYDIWFQLGPDVLIERYHRINREANARLKSRLGGAYDAENIRQKVIFGAGKRCAPNALWSLGCYPVPESPIPMDIYNADTDTVIGHNMYFSARQRFVNSGYIMGTVASMRAVFRRANHMAERNEEKPIYNGSDQAIFAIIFGHQEYMRETLRLKHTSRVQNLLHPERAAKPASNVIEGTYIDDILNPSITHEPFDQPLNLNYEFGIGLDYFSDLGHQTMNSDIGRDANWLNYTDPRTLKAQVKPNRKIFDCKLSLPEQLPSDITRSSIDTNSADQSATPFPNWEQLSLYTHLCLGTIPVMIHHNGGKNNREALWSRVWMQAEAKQLLENAREVTGDANDVGTLEEFRQRPGIKEAGGAWTDKGEWLNWEGLCDEGMRGMVFGQ